MRFLRLQMDVLVVAGVTGVVWFVAWSRSVEDHDHRGYYPPLPLPPAAAIAHAHMSEGAAAAATQPYVTAVD